MADEQKKPAAADVELPGGYDGGARATWPFGGDHVMRATEKYPPEARDAVRWLFYYCQEQALSMDEAARGIRYDKTTVYRIMKGEYGAGVGKIADAINSFRRITEQRKDIAATTFVETRTAQKIWKYCDLAVQYKTFSFIYGDSQIGKTFALLRYKADHNHGLTRYVRLGACAGVQMLMRDCARESGFSVKSCFENLRKRVFDATDENILWIFDEIHQTFVSYHRNARLSCLEIIRELHDRTGCPIVLCGTNVARDEIEGGDHAKLLEQLRRRGIFKLQLPHYATRSDLVAIAKSYGLPAPTEAAMDLVAEIIKGSGLKSYTTYLKAAGKLAAKKEQKLNWDHFVSAHDVIAKLSCDQEERE